MIPSRWQKGRKGRVADGRSGQVRSVFLPVGLRDRVSGHTESDKDRVDRWNYFSDDNMWRSGYVRLTIGLP